MSSATLGTSYADLDDFDLVVACQRKSEAAFNVLYKRYLPFVRGVAWCIASRQIRHKCTMTSYKTSSSEFGSASLSCRIQDRLRHG